MEQIMEYLPFLIPLLAVEMILAAAALVHVLKHKNYRFGNRAMWVAIVLLVEIIGPILYFTMGRSDD
ncbi:MAG: PLDc_N domain-containing protein [Clostridiales bacterium]|nr:PLDc_N domain-containing protein [Clostridiales bacterium]